MLHTELARTGAVWVGVTAQYVGVEGRAGSVFPLHLKGVDAARYGSLSHPGDSYSYDIYSQAGQAVRGLGTIDVLDGLTAERVIAVGESQSAARMLTYANAFADITDIYDGYLIHSRLGGAAPLSQAPQPVLDAPDIVRVRPLLAKPVLMLQTETDVVLLGSAPSRQRDGYNFRLWEIAGTGHADLYTLNTGANDPGNDPAIAAVAEVSQVAIYNCDLPVNAGPQHWVAKAAIRALDTWIATGDAPSEAPRIQLTPDESAIARDANGNALGGVRTPYLDAPLATLSGEGQTANGFCGIFGTTALFDAATLATLYADDAAYESAVIVSTDQAVADGFILAEDAALIKAHAATVTLP
jgi:hypothetical protein